MENSTKGHLKIIGKIFYLSMHEAEYSKNPFLRAFGGCLRSLHPYFSPKSFYFSWVISGRKSILSWYFFKLQSMLRQFTTYTFPSTKLTFEKQQLAKARKMESGSNKYSEDILVSVIIPTFNRSELLTKFAVPSVLNQTHKNLELIVVGDHCTDDTEQKMKLIDDLRVKFINLPKQGDYPKIGVWRWLVAGADPLNYGLKIAKGDWITHLDDDVEFTKSHIQKSLEFAYENNYELVHSLLGEMIEEKKWRYRGHPEWVNNCTVVFRGYLKLFNVDSKCWKMNEPGDGNRWKRMILSGVRMGFHDKDFAARCLAEGQVRYLKKSKSSQLSDSI